MLSRRRQSCRRSTTFGPLSLSVRPCQHPCGRDFFPRSMWKGFRKIDASLQMYNGSAIIVRRGTWPSEAEGKEFNFLKDYSLLRWHSELQFRWSAPSWRWSQYAPLKRRYTPRRLPGPTSQKALIFKLRYRRIYLSTGLQPKKLKKLFVPLWKWSLKVFDPTEHLSASTIFRNFIQPSHLIKINLPSWVRTDRQTDSNSYSERFRMRLQIVLWRVKWIIKHFQPTFLPKGKK
jgi:hypothetical protein